MSTLSQIREGLGQAWEALAEGWHDLRERASHALTRFHPHPKAAHGDLTSTEEQALSGASRWGLLAAEVAENDDQVVVKLEAPGLEPENFEIQVIDTYLVVRGEKRIEREQRQGRYYLTERAYGSFERAIPLPAEVEEHEARAKYRHGVLRIVLPKNRQTRARRISVQSG